MVATKPNTSPSEKSLVRLNKLIADSGIASRRKADKLIEDGEVMINGKRVYELGVKVDPRTDKIVVSGKPLRQKLEHVYIMFNKPRGVLTTMSDPLERPTIKDYVEHLHFRVFPVGRLDWDSEGLLLLTNDGEWANKIMHPELEVTKTYLVKLNRMPSPEALQKLQKGVSIVGGRVSARNIEKIPRGRDEHPWLKVIIDEGKNRQIRQMFEKIGCDVMKLQRVAIGRLRLGNLERGQMVFLNDVAAERVFLPDEPDEVKVKKSYKKPIANKRSAAPRSKANPVRSSKKAAKKTTLFD